MCVKAAMAQFAEVIAGARGKQEPMQQIAVAILSPHSKMYHERAPFLVSQINMDKDPFAWEDVKLHRQERTVQRSSITSRTPWILAPCPSHSGC